MPGLFSLSRPDDPVQTHARKYARIIAKFRRKFPDRPLRECLSPVVLFALRAMFANGTFERERLEAIVSPDESPDDPVEFCCRLVTFHTGIEPAEGRAYLDQA